MNTLFTVYRNKNFKHTAETCHTHMLGKVTNKFSTHAHDSGLFM